MVLCDKDGNIVKVYSYGCEEQQRYEKIQEILFEADKKRLEKLLNKKKERAEQVNQILDESDKKIIRRSEKKKLKRYNLSQTAKILDLPRQSLYYWIKKGWVKPRRDCRRYPVFTVFDIEEIIKWRNTIK
ncbi:MAG: hypothetical protein KJ710_00900 [Candidatus Omnitrophica bacterium]|nr:hypothetical protein [Candidatus Omnitrophota bacterium]